MRGCAIDCYRSRVANAGIPCFISRHYPSHRQTAAVSINQREGAVSRERSEVGDGVALVEYRAGRRAAGQGAGGVDQAGRGLADEARRFEGDIAGVAVDAAVEGDAVAVAGGREGDAQARHGAGGDGEVAAGGGDRGQAGAVGGHRAGDVEPAGGVVQGEGAAGDVERAEVGDGVALVQRDVARAAAAGQFAGGVDHARGVLADAAGRGQGHVAAVAVDRAVQGDEVAGADCVGGGQADAQARHGARVGGGAVHH